MLKTVHPTAIIVFLAVAAILVQWLLSSFKLSHLRHRSDGPADFKTFCSDLDQINYVQKRQLREARLEVFNSDQRIFHGEQTLFYDHSFGSVVIESTTDKSDKYSLVYYRIWKNGNDNIRAHLSRFSSICNVSRGDMIGCSGEYSLRDSWNRTECVKSCRLETLPPTQSKKRRDIKGNKRFAFTFVREPLARFISGYTEVEYRLKAGGYQQYYVPLYGKVGSQERFKEFVRMIIKSDASKALLQEKNVELPHVSPQIGSILRANAIEKEPIRLFKLENFDENWEMLADASGYSGLKAVHNTSQLVVQPTSSDPLKTSEAARRFLSDALRPQRMDGATEDETLEEKKTRSLANSYLRAICRVYLVDFVCTGYDLPTSCEDLTLELQDSLAEREIEIEKLSRMHWLRYIVPSTVVRWYAELLCSFSAPQCVTDILHGKDSGIDLD